MGVGDWLQRLLGAPKPPDPGPAQTAISQPPVLPAALPDVIVLTDDMTVVLPSGRSVAEVVELVILGCLDGRSAAEIEARLSSEFGLSPEDAAVARDRACGGLVRAGTRVPENRPSPVKDPVAWESYQRGTRDPSLVSRIYPQMFPGG